MPSHCTLARTLRTRRSVCLKITVMSACNSDVYMNIISNFTNANSLSLFINLWCLADNCLMLLSRVGLPICLVHCFNSNPFLGERNWLRCCETCCVMDDLLTEVCQKCGTFQSVRGVSRRTACFAKSCKHVLKTTSKTPSDGEVLNLMLIPTIRRNPTDFVAGLVKEECAYYDKMIAITEIHSRCVCQCLGCPRQQLPSRWGLPWTW